MLWDNFIFYTLI